MTFTAGTEIAHAVSIALRFKAYRYMCLQVCDAAANPLADV